MNYIHFDNLVKTNKEFSYILGFLWADGYLRNVKNSFDISLEIKKTDFDELYDTMFSYRKWTTRFRTRKTGKPLGEFRIRSKTLGEFLFSMDYKSKSIMSPTKILDYLPKKFHKYWWRGYFDGDGSFSYEEKTNSGRFQIWSTFHQDWSSFLLLMKKININPSLSLYERTSKNKKIHKSSCYSISDKPSLIKLKKYLYPEGYESLGLMRKYKILEMSSSPYKRDRKLVKPKTGAKIIKIYKTRS